MTFIYVGIHLHRCNGNIMYLTLKMKFQTVHASAHGMHRILH